MALRAPRIASCSAEEIMREAKRLVPQYCPEWTHLGDADPGVTLLQLVAWMTEVGTQRLNRLPDRLHAHFLSLLGERRRPAIPATADLCFSALTARFVPVGTVCLAQDELGSVLRFLTREPVLASPSRLVRAVWVDLSEAPRVRALAVEPTEHVACATLRGTPGAQGLSRWRDGADCRVDRLGLTLRLAEAVPLAGRLRVQAEGVDITDLFDWHLRTGARSRPLPVGTDGSLRVEPTSEGAELLGEGRVERFLAAYFSRELDVSWVDDRSHQACALSAVQVGFDATAVHLRLRGLPLGQQPGTLRLDLTTPRVRLTSAGVLPALRWEVLRAGVWETIPEGDVLVRGGSTELRLAAGCGAEGALQLRAERVGRVELDAVLPDLVAEVSVEGDAPLYVALGGADGKGAEVDAGAFPITPFQVVPGLAPDAGASLMLGSERVLGEDALVVSVELDAALPAPLLATWEIRSERGWVPAAVAEGPAEVAEGAGLALESGARRLVWRLRPCAEAMRCAAGGASTGWLRLRLSPKPAAEQPAPMATWTLAVREVAMRAADQEPGASLCWRTSAEVEAEEVGGVHPCFARRMRRQEGQVQILQPPGDPIALEGPRHRALYLRFDPPLPAGGPHRIALRSADAAAVPEPTWEALSPEGWVRGGEGDAGGLVLDHACTWLRARWEHGITPPAVARVDLGCVAAVNLHEVVERHRPNGAAGEQLSLRQPPVYAGEDPQFVTSLVAVGASGVPTDEAGWRVGSPRELRHAAEGERVFVIDPAEGTLEVGGGRFGRSLPVGAGGVEVRYHHVPGRRGCVAAGAIDMVEGLDGVEVCNPDPAGGGVDAEALEDALRRAPDVISGPLRAVTAEDFETVARAADPAVARAHCGPPTLDGVVEVVIVPSVAAASSPAGVIDALAARVQAELEGRCVLGVMPRVRMVRWVDVAVEVVVRWWSSERDIDGVQAWVRRYLDAWHGGPRGDGIGLGAGLDARDLGRVVTKVGAVRHVVRARLTAAGPIPGLGDALTIPCDGLPRVVSVRVRDAEESP